MQPSGNPILDEIDRAHGQLSPQAQRAISMSGVPQQALGGQQAQMAEPPLRPIPGIPHPVQGLGPTPAGIAAPPPTSQVGAPPYERGTLGGEKVEQTRLATTSSGLDQLSKNHPWIGRPLQVADAIGRAFLPGIEMGIPGTSGHHDMLVHKQDSRVKGMEQNANDETKRAQEEAVTQHTQAQTADLQNPTPPEPANAFQLWRQQNPQGTLADYQTATQGAEKPQDLPGMLATATRDAISRGVHPKDDAGVQQILDVMHETGKPTVEKEPGKDDKYIKQLTADNIAKGMNPEEAFKTAYRQYVKENKIDPGVQRAVTFNMGRGVQTVDEQGTVHYDTLGNAIHTNAPAAANIPGSTRATRQFADTVTQQVPVIQREVDELKDKLGPGAGRWNELWVKKGGMNDPEFAGLDQDLRMYASAIVRVHFGMGGGENIRMALEKDFSEAQSPQDLKARIEHADTWVQGYANMGNVKSGGTGQKSSASAPTVNSKAEFDKLPSGATYMEGGKRFRKP